MKTSIKSVLGMVVLGSLALGGCKPKKDDSVPLEKRIEAAEKVAQNSLACLAIQPFYWEIGQSSGKLASSGALGAALVNPNVPMDIASASKWVFATYAAEKLNGNLQAADIDYLNMTSPYTNLNFTSCQLTQTVAQCFHLLGNDRKSAGGVFKYDGGHFQAYATNLLGMGNMRNSDLASEYSRVLGYEFGFDFSVPQLAGGMKISPAGYAKFLQKMLRGGFQMSGLLGSNVVKTTGAGTENPTGGLGQVWEYSLGHWLETDPNWGDDSYSSPGAYGFYPWIDKTESYYGIIARKSLIPGAHTASVKCGQRIRAAWLTGVVPPANF